MKNAFCRLLLVIAGLCLGHCASAQIAGAAWESVKKEAHANAGDTNAVLTFVFTNTSSSVISIERVTPSCGCTIMKLPDLPWKIAPNAVAKIPADIDLRGKHGVLAKTITIDTSAGNERLTFKVMIPLSAGASQRQANQMMAAADRQAVFKGDCAKCHAEPAKGKMGAELYQAVCAICHDSNDLAVMVPDLKFIKYASDDMGFWERWMLKGREDSLMPMFGQKEGGPLTDEQIASLAKFLERQFPPEKQ